MSLKEVTPWLLSIGIVIWIVIALNAYNIDFPLYVGIPLGLILGLFLGYLCIQATKS